MPPYAPPINQPKKASELPASIDLGHGVSFVFEADRSGNIIGASWVHPRKDTGLPCANPVYFNLPATQAVAARPTSALQGRLFSDVWSWSPLGVDWYGTCYSTGCNNHGRIIGGVYVEC